jgi:NDP-sugar pyrophosphorylase family protein
MTDKWCAVVLAGGMGERLRPLTAKICKPMVPVANRPMVDYAIDHLRYAGIKKIIIIVKHLGDELRSLIQAHWPPELQKQLGIEILVPKVDSKGTADAVRKVAQSIDTDNFVVSMADIVTNMHMRKFMEFHEAKNAQSTVSMKRIEQMATKYGNTLLDENARIIRFLEKPTSEEIYLSALSGGAREYLPIVNTGIYCFKKEILKVITESTMMDFGSEIFPYLLENHYELYGYVEDYYWLDVGNPLTYLWANWDILRLYGWPIEPLGIRQGQNSLVWYLDNQQLPPQVSHGDNICIGKNNSYGQNVRIHQLSAIGSNCVFGNDVFIDRSVIWDNVRVGKSVQIIASVISNGVEVGDNCVIKSETVIGPNAKIPPNTILDSKIVDTK